MSMLKATSHLAFFFELRQNCAEMSSKLNEEEGKGIKVGTCVTFSHLSNFVLLLLDEKVANAILDSYLAKVMGGATYFTVYENHSMVIC